MRCGSTILSPGRTTTRIKKIGKPGLRTARIFSARVEADRAAPEPAAAAAVLYPGIPEPPPCELSGHRQKPGKRQSLKGRRRSTTARLSNSSRRVSLTERLSGELNNRRSNLIFRQTVLLNYINIASARKF